MSNISANNDKIVYHESRKIAIIKGVGVSLNPIIKGLQIIIGLVVASLFWWQMWQGSPYKIPYTYKNWDELQQRYTILMTDILASEMQPDDIQIYNRQGGTVYRQAIYHRYDQAMIDRIAQNAINQGWEPMPSDFYRNAVFHACKDEIGLVMLSDAKLYVRTYWHKTGTCERLFTKTQPDNNSQS